MSRSGRLNPVPVDPGKKDNDENQGCDDNRANLSVSRYPVQDAAAKMEALNVGLLPIGNGERLLGMFTERDIALRVCAEGLDADTTKVGQVMTPDVIHAYEDQEVEEAVKMTEDHAIRSLIIFNRDEQMTGIVSLADLGSGTDDWSPEDVSLDVTLEEAS